MSSTDTSAHTHRPTVGILYPGYSAEDDYPRLERLLDGSARLPVTHTHMHEDAHRPDALRLIGSDDTLAHGAKQALEHQPDSVIWACTSGSFVFGWNGAREQVEALQAVTDLPTSSTSFAFAHAAAHLGLNRVAVAATYPADVAELFGAFLGHAGVQVVSLASRGIITAAEVGELTREQLAEFASRHDDDRAQALLLPDTALHTIESIADLEQRLGKPVLTANQVSAWEGLRLAGYRTTHTGLGALFATPLSADPSASPTHVNPGHPSTQGDT